RHDLRVLLALLLFHLLHFRLANHGFDPCAKMAGNAPDLADPPTRRAQGERQVLRADHDHGHDHDDEQFGGADIEHGSDGAEIRDQRLLSRLSAGFASRAASDAGFASCTGPSIRGDGFEALPSSSFIPSLNLLMPLPKSPIISEMRPRPKRTRMTSAMMMSCQGPSDMGNLSLLGGDIGLSTAMRQRGAGADSRRRRRLPLRFRIG